MAELPGRPFDDRHRKLRALPMVPHNLVDAVGRIIIRQNNLLQAGK
jgi:hypothetical protein